MAKEYNNRNSKALVNKGFTMAEYEAAKLASSVSRYSESELMAEFESFIDSQVDLMAQLKQVETCTHDDIKLTGRFETEQLQCRCGFKIGF